MFSIGTEGDQESAREEYGYLDFYDCLVYRRWICTGCDLYESRVGTAQYQFCVVYFDCHVQYAQ